MQQRAALLNIAANNYTVARCCFAARKTCVLVALAQLALANGLSWVFCALTASAAASLFKKVPLHQQGRIALIGRALVIWKHVVVEHDHAANPVWHDRFVGNFCFHSPPVG